MNGLRVHDATGRSPGREQARISRTANGGAIANSGVNAPGGFPAAEGIGSTRPPKNNYYPIPSLGQTTPFIPALSPASAAHLTPALRAPERNERARSCKPGSHPNSSCAPFCRSGSCRAGFLSQAWIFTPLRRTDSRPAECGQRGEGDISAVSEDPLSSAAPGYR
jgi:hypothetical protein